MMASLLPKEVMSQMWNPAAVMPTTVTLPTDPCVMAAAAWAAELKHWQYKSDDKLEMRWECKGVHERSHPTVQGNNGKLHRTMRT